MRFGALKALNEDRVAGGGGFAPHAHSDMEILTYVIEGALKHRDSSGGEGTIRAGDIQRMSAGKGIVHSEFNASANEPCHFLQIWVAPSQKGLEPSYEQKSLDLEATRNRFVRVASSEPMESEIRIFQDAEVSMALLDRDMEAMHPIAPGRRAWLQIFRGRAVLDDVELASGDGAAITDIESVLVRSRDACEMLLFDLA
jgi:redox-sensitive bicupin YhaK (pirin superfamily)